MSSAGVISKFLLFSKGVDFSTTTSLPGSEKLPLPGCWQGTQLYSWAARGVSAPAGVKPILSFFWEIMGKLQYLRRERDAGFLCQVQTLHTGLCNWGLSLSIDWNPQPPFPLWWCTILQELHYFLWSTLVAIATADFMCSCLLLFVDAIGDVKSQSVSLHLLGEQDTFSCQNITFWWGGKKRQHLVLDLLKLLFVT